MYRPPDRNQRTMFWWTYDRAPRSTRHSSPYTLSRRNVNYYNPWTADDYVQATTPPWTNRTGPRTLEQLALRRSVQLGLPTPSILGGQRAATQIQLSFRDYLRRSERTQCVDVLRNCHGYSKKRIIQCLLEFMEYLVYGQPVNMAISNDEIYEKICNRIVGLLASKTEEDGNVDYELLNVGGEMLFYFIEQATPGERNTFFRKELAAVSKRDLQNIIDDTILEYISPMIYEI